MKFSSLLSLSAVTTLAFAAGCGSDDTLAGDPQITAATITDSPVPQNADGSYTVDVSVTFDDVVDVDSYTFDSDAADLHFTGTFAPTLSGTLPLTVHLPDGTASGTLDVHITVIDVNNFISNSFDISVDLD